MTDPAPAPAPEPVATRPAADTRNLHWKSNNVGLKMLEKMGWKDGQAVGKRQRQDPLNAVSSEGLRVVKRSTGLGLGASAVAAKLRSSHHTEHFCDLLKQLNQEHKAAAAAQDGSTPNTATANAASSDSKKRKKRKTRAQAAPPVLPTNKTTHHKVRQAKFQPRSADDLKCIFGGAADGSVFAVAAAAVTNDDDDSSAPKKRKKEAKRQKKKSKKEQ